jgi:hypothetical protein
MTESQVKKKRQLSQQELHTKRTSDEMDASKEVLQFSFFFSSYLIMALLFEREKQLLRK